jgi:hypothetical protein
VKRGLPVLAVALLVGTLAACTPKPSPSPPFPAQGFDTCAAPSTTTMQTWWNSSPFTSVGIYVGGANRGCAQPNLTRTWIDTVTAQGWGLIPIWVGPQAPCTTLGSTTTIIADDFFATISGLIEGGAAADRMTALGFTWLAPVYYDMEAYPRSTDCSRQVRLFSEGWVYALNSRGFSAGFYSSQCSGILDLENQLPVTRYVMNQIWIAAWNNTPNIFGFQGGSCSIRDSDWSNHQRLHQFMGGHDEAWGAVTINIDSDAVDGATYRR